MTFDLNVYNILQIACKSHSGNEQSSKLFIVLIEIESPALKIIIATIMAMIGSRRCMPVSLISNKPMNTPREDKISVLKCSASAYSDTDSESFATLNNTVLTMIFATTEIPMTTKPRVVSTVAVDGLMIFFKASKTINPAAKIIKPPSINPDISSYLPCPNGCFLSAGSEDFITEKNVKTDAKKSLKEWIASDMILILPEI